ncbi:hypothetical protein J3P95_07990 [Pseudomonas sp. Z5-35]|uniref:hypothetical protein n=1 Tax=unclassified Pseudomonas TaxID=196821 RepID=UPI003DA7EE7F
MSNISTPFSSDISLNNQATPHVPCESATLPCPRVEEAPTDVLDLSRVFETVHVLIEYPQMTRNDVLIVSWQGTTPSGCTRGRLTVTDVVEDQPVRFTVGVECVMPNMGQRVRVSYALWRSAARAYEYSSTLSLLVHELVA